jgi:hypothetical protein
MAAKEICAALAVRPAADGATAFSPDRRILGEPKTLMEDVCCSLIKARGEDGILYPIHSTVTQHLKQYMENSERATEIASFYQVQQILSSNSLAAAVCMRYLSSAVITDLRDQVPANLKAANEILKPGESRFDFLRYAAAHWFQHAQSILESEKLVLDVAKELLDSRNENADILWRLFWFYGPEDNRAKDYTTSFSVISLFRPSPDRPVPAADIQAPNLLDGSARSPLWWASTGGHTPVVEFID